MRLARRPLALFLASISLAAACASPGGVRSTTSGAAGSTGTGHASSSGAGSAGGAGGAGGAGTGSSTSVAGPGGAGMGGAGATGVGGAGVGGAGAGGAVASTGSGCFPQCAGVECGPDGCGGDCGACSAGLACTSGGACVGSPPGPAVNRFDVSTFQCSATYAGCTVAGKAYDHCCPQTVPGDPTNKCFCQPEFDHLNVGAPHFLAVGSEQHKGDLWAAGNFQAVYVNDLNDVYPGTGDAKADAVISSATASFAGGVPKWFLVNEISTGLWPTDPTYRLYVRAFAARMAQHYNKSVIIASPFPKPGANAADWTALAGNAFVAVEIQLTGKDVNTNNNSVAWCATQFQASVTAYGNVGVSLSKLMLVDSYADSGAATGFGRQGVSAAGWKNAIDARAQAAAQVGFAGYVSYAWANDEMADTAATRAGFEDTYSAHALP